MAGRRPIARAGLAGAALLVLAMAAGAQGVADAGGSGTSGGTRPDAAAQAADPSRLIDPNMYATAIEVGETQHFGSITVMPVDKSENSRALIRSVLDDQDGLEALHRAVRGNSQLMAVLTGKGIPAGDVVSVTTDQNDNAIVFVKH